MKTARRSVFFGSLCVLLLPAITVGDNTGTRRLFRARQADYQTSMRLWYEDPSRHAEPADDQTLHAASTIFSRGDDSWAAVVFAAAADSPGYAGDGRPLLYLLSVALPANDPNEIRGLLTKIIGTQLDPVFVEPLRILSNAESQPTLIEGPLNALPALVEKHRNEILLVILCAEIEARYSKPQLAAPLFEWALSHVDPGPAAVHEGYASTLEALELYGSALPQRRLIVQMKPTAESHGRLASLLAKLRRWDDAEAEFRTAVATDDQIDWIWSEWSACELAQGRNDRSHECLQKAQKATSDWADFKQ